MRRRSSSRNFPERPSSPLVRSQGRPRGSGQSPSGCASALPRYTGQTSSGAQRDHRVDLGGGDLGDRLERWFEISTPISRSTAIASGLTRVGLEPGGTRSEGPRAAMDLAIPSAIWLRARVRERTGTECLSSHRASFPFVEAFSPRTTPREQRQIVSGRGSEESGGDVPMPRDHEPISFAPHKIRFRYSGEPRDPTGPGSPSSAVHDRLDRDAHDSGLRLRNRFQVRRLDPSLSGIRTSFNAIAGPSGSKRPPQPKSATLTRPDQPPGLDERDR